MREKKRGPSGFTVGLLIYILVFSLIAAGGLLVLNRYLDAYENSRPNQTVRAYAAQAEAGELSPAWEACFQQLDTRVQPVEDSRRFVSGLFAGANTRELVSHEDGEKCFGFFDGENRCFLRLTLRQTGEEHWGFTGWEVSDESCELDAYTQTYTIAIPQTYTLLFDGKPLDSGFVVEKSIPYALLQPCALLLDPEPTMVGYSVGPYLGEERTQIAGADGRIVSEDALTEQHFLDNCSEKEREALREFIGEYLDVYLPYAADLNSYGMAYWHDLSKRIVSDGELAERLILVRKSFGYSGTSGIKVLSIDYKLFSNLGDGHYFVDINYRTETKTHHEATEEDNMVRLLIRLEEDTFLMEGMYNY